MASEIDANIGNEKCFSDKFLPLFSNSSDINIKNIGERYMKMCEQSKMNQAKRTHKTDVENQNNENNSNQRLALKRKVDQRSAARGNSSRRQQPPTSSSNGNDRGNERKPLPPRKSRREREDSDDGHHSKEEDERNPNGDLEEIGIRYRQELRGQLLSTAATTATLTTAATTFHSSTSGSEENDLSNSNLLDIFNGDMEPRKKLIHLFERFNIEYDVNVDVELNDISENGNGLQVNRQQINYLKTCYQNQGVDHVLHYSFLVLCKGKRRETEFFTVDGIARIQALKEYTDDHIECSTKITADFVCYGIIPKQLKVLITSFAELKVGSLKKYYNEEEILKNGRLIIKYYPEMLQMNLTLDDSAKNVKEIEEKEAANDTSINHQLCRILNVKNPKTFKKSLWRTIWISDEHFDLMFEGIMATTDDDKILKEICAKYLKCPKRIVYILTHREIYSVRDVFRNALRESNYHEYDCWMKTNKIWESGKNEEWHQKQLMDDTFEQYDDEGERVQWLNDFITNCRKKRKNYINLDNMRKQTKTIKGKLCYLSERFQIYLKAKTKEMEAVADDTVAANGTLTISKIAKPRPKRGKFVTVKIPIDELEAEYIQPLIKTQNQEHAAIICNVIKRYATNAHTLSKDTLHSFEQQFEYQGGRMLLGVYRRGADRDPTRDANIGNEKWFNDKLWPLFSKSSDINIQKIGVKLCEQSKMNQAKRTHKTDVENQKNETNLNQRLALKREVDQRKVLLQ
uniref:Uncharacterized protein n=1 Tax=Panagrolaimus davidi TaxID=227884 RepID=A0A914Q502_9BILA